MRDTRRFAIGNYVRARRLLQRQSLKHLAKQQRLFDLTAKSLRKAERGPLDDFALFDDVMLPWLAANSDLEGTLEWKGISDKELAKREKKLGEALVQLIKDNDTRSLSNVSKVVRFLQDNFEPVDRYETELMLFFRRHADERWTIPEVQARFKAETGFAIEEKTLRRRCEQNGFYVVKRPVGRKRKTTK